MDLPIEKPNVLHLTGISLDDYKPIEDVFDEKLMEDVEGEKGNQTSPKSELALDKIPTVFTCVPKWPTSTNLRCWSCTFSFDGPPRFVPTHIRTGKAKHIFDIGVEGNFCSFNCASRYINDMYPARAYQVQNWRLQQNLCFVYELFTKTRVEQVQPAPAKTVLREFGGDLSPDEFWEKLRALDPLHGIRDHRPGTVVPERLRPSGQTIWGVCSPSSTPAKNVVVPEDGPKAAAGSRLLVPSARRLNNVASDDNAVVAKPDAVVAKPDAVVAKPDAVVAKPDAVAAKPDAVAAKPDAVAAKPDAVAAKPDAVVAKPDAVAAKPDAIAAKPDAIAAKPVNNGPGEKDGIPVASTDLDELLAELGDL